MAKAFDEMTYRQDFEAINGRQPLDEEIEQARGLVERYTVGPNDDNGVVAHHSSKTSRFKAFMGTAFGWIMRGGTLLVMTPVFLTLLFFNLIKSFIAVFVVWFVSKFMLFLIFGEFFFSAIRQPLMNLKEHQVYYEMLAVFSLERVYLPMICQTFSSSNS